MFCKMCGTQIPEGGRFCPVCGAPAPVGEETPRREVDPAREPRRAGAPPLRHPDGRPGPEQAPEHPEKRLKAEKEPEHPKKRPKPAREKIPKSQRRNLGWLIALLAVVFVLAASALTGSLVLYRQKQEGGQSQVTVPVRELDREAYRKKRGIPEPEESADEPSVLGVSPSYFTVPDPLLPTVAASTDAAPGSAAAAGEYIFPDSNTRYLTRAEVEALDSQQLRLARNEIFARLGRTFTDPDLQAYFNSKSWYVGRYTPEEFDAMGDSVLNQYEIANSQLIIDVEAARGQ